MAAFILLFLLSGASALVYQVVWQRLLSTIFGVTVYATSTVLAAFMAGLALGGVLGGRAADLLRRPLLLFAAAEAGIGIAGLATPRALALAEHAYAALRESAPLGFAGLTAARFACSFLVLLVPTTLMGATLPAMAAALPPRPEGLRSRLAALYGVNTLGAFAGTLLAGYVLIGGFGLHGTLRVAVAANLVVAAASLLLGLRGERASTLGASAPVPGGRSLSPGQGRVLLAAFAVSGMVALGLEVVWFRMLVAYLPTTTYAFTSMLATVLAGIALGGLFAARRSSQDGELGRLGTLLAWSSALSVASANVLARTYAAGWRTSGLVQACAVALLPAATAMGMSYPRGLALWVASSERVGFKIGAFSAFNLGGAIVGSLLAGFVLLPALGTRGALLALAASCLLAGMALALCECSPARRAPLRALAALLLLFLASAATLPDPFAAARGRRYPGESLLWSEESAQANVALHRAENGRRVLYIDGIHQADDSPETRVLHGRLGLLPLLLHPAARRALVIGLAGGAASGALALDAGVRTDVVELSAAVVHAAELLHDLNGDVLRRPNVQLRVDDGRNHLLLTRERYDVITADLIQPFHAGAGHLYSVEYFRLCRRALTPHGLMVQWIGHPPEEQYKLILRTFLEVFPETTLWGGAFLVGATTPLRVENGVFERIRGKPELAAAVAAAGMPDRAALLRLYTAGPAALRTFAGSGPILTDDRPLVEYYLSLRGAARPVDLSKLGAADPADLDTP